MTLKSALEDLSETTLKAVSGLLAKLDYVAGLRKKGGTYYHWGLSRVHGERQAQEALEQTHRSLLSRVLRAPIRSLAADVEASSQQRGVPPAEYLNDLRARGDQMLPPNASGGADRHFSSVLTALLSLLKRR